MNILLLCLAAAVGIVSLVCWIIILIDAFQDEWWKGAVMIILPIYGFYFAVFDFEHENKWLIVLLAFCGTGIVGGILSFLH